METPIETNGADASTTTVEAPGASSDVASINTPSANADQTAPSEALADFDSFDAFSATPWLSELPEDRRVYLTNGVKRAFDKHREALEAQEAAARDAATFKSFLDAAHPDFSSLTSKLSAAETRLKELESAASDYEKVKADYAAGEASLAELKAAHAANMEALESAKKAADDAKREADAARAERASQEEVYYGVLEDMTLAALRNAFPAASEHDMALALDAFHGAFKEPTPGPDGKVSDAWRREMFMAGLAAAQEAMPKPDFVPDSVRAMNVGNRSMAGAAPSDEALAAAFSQARGDGFEAAKEVAARFGVTTDRIFAAVQRRSGRKS